MICNLIQTRIFLLFLISVFCSTQIIVAQDCDNRNCILAEVLPSLTTDMICLTGCNNGSEVGQFIPGVSIAMGTPFPTSWYVIEKLDSDRILNLELNSSDLAEAHVVIYEGTCESLTPLVWSQSEDGALNLDWQLLSASELHWIAVSSMNGSEGNFDLCLTLEEDLSICNVNSEIEIVSTSKGSSKEGPFLSEEIVEFCYTINGFNNRSCNYLQGIQPTFGSGWDDASFDTSGKPANVTQELLTQGHTEFTTADPICEGEASGQWIWYEDEIVYNLNSHNPMGYKYGDKVSEGWFFLNAFDPSCFEFVDACCVNPTDNPNLSYGDDDYPLCGRGLTQEWKICFSLITKSEVACGSNSDCSIAMKTFADGEVGAYISNACSNDRINKINRISSCCAAPKLSANATEINVCPGEAFNILVSSDDPSSRFFGYDPEGNFLLFDSSELDFTNTIEEAGRYTYDIYSANGCISEVAQVTVIVESELDARIVQVPAMVCEGETITLKAVLAAAPSSDDIEVNWSDQSLGTEAEISMLAEVGNYAAEIKFGACKTTVDHSIQIFPKSTLELSGSSSVCEGDSITLTYEMSGAGPWEVLLISDAGDTKSMLINTALHTEKWIGDRDKIFYVSEALDANGCGVVVSGEVEIKIDKNPELSAGDDTVQYCDQEVQLLADFRLAAADSRITWEDENGTVLSNDEALTTAVAGTYMVNLMDVNTGCTSSDAVTISQDPQDMTFSILDGSDRNLEKGESIQLELLLDFPSQDVALIEWSNQETLNCQDCMSPMATPQINTTYEVAITDVHGCTVLRSITILVESPEPKVYLPDVFEPGGQEENACFKAFHDGDVDRLITFQVYDRWGNLVYSVKDVDSEDPRACWDGVYAGSRPVTGVYVYKIEVAYVDGSKDLKVGHITLL